MNTNSLGYEHCHLTLQKHWEDLPALANSIWQRIWHPRWEAVCVEQEHSARLLGRAEKKTNRELTEGKLTYFFKIQANQQFLRGIVLKKGSLKHRFINPPWHWSWLSPARTTLKKEEKKSPLCFRINRHLLKYATEHTGNNVQEIRERPVNRDKVCDCFFETKMEIVWERLFL